MSDLRKLIETVEAGAWCGDTTDLLGHGGHMNAYRAFAGSLDAAKALHEALLPGCSAVIQTNGTAQTIRPNYERHTGVTVDAPARAWLIAILKAYEAKNA